MVVFLVGLGFVDVALWWVLTAAWRRGAEPWRGLHLFEDVEVLVADHVGDDEGLDVLQGSVGVPPGGEVAVP